MDAKLVLACLSLVLAAPFAVAQNDSGNGGDDVDIVPPDNVDVDVTENNGDPDESVGVGMSGTTVVILIVVAVLVIALVAALAGRDRW